jgi:hypothetical protein
VKQNRKTNWTANNPFIIYLNADITFQPCLGFFLAQNISELKLLSLKRQKTAN